MIQITFSKSASLTPMAIERNNFSSLTGRTFSRTVGTTEGFTDTNITSDRFTTGTFSVNVSTPKDLNASMFGTSDGWKLAVMFSLLVKPVKFEKKKKHKPEYEIFRMEITLFQKQHPIITDYL